MKIDCILKILHFLIFGIKRKQKQYSFDARIRIRQLSIWEGEIFSTLLYSNIGQKYPMNDQSEKINANKCLQSLLNLGNNFYSGQEKEKDFT